MYLTNSAPSSMARSTVNLSTDSTFDSDIEPNPSPLLFDSRNLLSNVSNNKYYNTSGNINTDNNHHMNNYNNTNYKNISIPLNDPILEFRKPFFKLLFQPSLSDYYHSNSKRQNLKSSQLQGDRERNQLHHLNDVEYSNVNQNQIIDNVSDLNSKTLGGTRENAFRTHPSITPNHKISKDIFDLNPESFFASIVKTLLATSSSSSSDIFDMWKLCSKARDAIPQGPRLENFSWNLTFLTLAREKQQNIKSKMQQQRLEEQNHCIEPFCIDNNHSQHQKQNFNQHNNGVSNSIIPAGVPAAHISTSFASLHHNTSTPIQLNENDTLPPFFPRHEDSMDCANPPPGRTFNPDLQVMDSKDSNIQQHNIYGYLPDENNLMINNNNNMSNQKENSESGLKYIFKCNILISSLDLNRYYTLAIINCT